MLAYSPLSFKKLGEDNFVGQVCGLVEILLGTGRQTQAESIAAQGLAVLDDPRLRSAVADAEARIATRKK